MHSLFEIYEKRPDFDTAANISDSLDTQSDDEFVLI